MNEIKNLGVPLQEWINGNPVRDEMLWNGAAGHQLMFVRDRLVPVFGAGLDYEQQKQIATVIATHRSKSIELPVYQLERPDQDLRIVLRDNFYNWKMSVLSGTPIQADFSGLFHTTPPIEPDYTGDPLHPVYFEGFPRKLIFGYFGESDGKKWSAEMQDNKELWTAVFLTMRSLDYFAELNGQQWPAELQSEEAQWTSEFLMKRSLGEIKPLVWHTRESHRKELGLDK